MAADITEDFQVDLTSAANAAGATITNTGLTYDVAFNSEPFFMASGDNNAYRRQTAQYRKDQSDNSSEPGEQSLTGWWLRSQSSFHLGAGIKFYEPAQDSGNLVANQTLRFRFEDSKGVDVWTPGEAKLLKQMNQRHVVTGSSPTDLRPVKWGSEVGALMVDQYDVDKILPETVTAVITNKALTSNVATLTTSASHGFKVGMGVVVTGVGSPFDGESTITAITSTTFSFAETASNVTSTAVTPNGAASSNVYHFIDYNSGDSSEVYAICDDGTYAYWVNNLDSPRKWNITKKPISGNSQTTDTSTVYVGAASCTSAVIEYAMERLIAGIDTKIFQVTLGGTATELYASPSASTTFTSITASGSDIYVATVDGIRSDIIKLSASATGTIATLGGGVVAAEMPRGELIYSIKYYLGYLLIGTSKGVRVAAIQSDGSLVYGPLLFESEQPIYQFACSDKYAWCTASISGDAGTIRINLGSQIDTLVFAYAKDVMADGSQKQCTGVSFVGDTNRLFITSSAGYAYAEDATVLRSTGFIKIGRVRFNTNENKYFKYVKERALYDGGSIGISTTSTNIITVDGTTGNTDIGISETNAAEFKQFIFTLNRDSTTTTLGPIFYGYQIKALPATRRQRLIQYNLYCFDNEQDRYRNRIGYTNRSFDRLNLFENLEASSDIVTVQDFRTGETFQGLIEECSFSSSTAPSKNFSGFGGILTVTVRKI